MTFEPGDEVDFVATDLLWLDDTSLLDVPLLERRRLLESAIVEIGSRPSRGVRPSADPPGSARGRPGLRRTDLQGGQQPLPAGRMNPEWAVSGMPRR